MSISNRPITIIRGDSLKSISFLYGTNKNHFYGFQLSGHILVTGHSLVHWPLSKIPNLKFDFSCHISPKLKDIYINNTSITRNKCVLLPKMNKAISDKNSYVIAIKTFNTLSNDLKCLNMNKQGIKNKIKNFIKCDAIDFSNKYFQATLITACKHLKRKYLMLYLSDILCYIIILLYFNF